MNGIINVLKPSNMTSHDVVSFMRRVTKIKKIGHTGTLDPNAAGVLPICIGKATRVSEYFNDSEITKTYRGELTLGKKTDTLDKYGEITQEKDIVEFSSEKLSEVLGKYKGEILQIPPMYSAKKIDGKKLYQLAREGKEIERKPRKVTIFSLNVIEKNKNTIMFDIECSSGTYIRTLFEDIASDLGNYGMMSFLLRKKVGEFTLETAYTLEEIEREYEKNKFENILKCMDLGINHLNRVDICNKDLKKVINGVSIEIEENKKYKDNERIRIYSDEKFLGIGIVKANNILKIDKILV